MKNEGIVQLFSPHELRRFNISDGYFEWECEGYPYAKPWDYVKVCNGPAVQTVMITVVRFDGTLCKYRGWPIGQPEIL